MNEEQIEGYLRRAAERLSALDTSEGEAQGERRRELASLTDDLRFVFAELRATHTSRRLLAEASGLLASSLDFEATLQSVAHLAVPTFADYCIVDLVQPNLSLRQVAVAHADPAKEELLRELRRLRPYDLDANWGVPRVMRTGQSELATAIPPIVEQALVANEPRKLIADQLHPVSYIIAPLRARGRTLGAISFVTSESGRQYGASEQRIAEEFAQRAALAVDNANLYTQAQEAVQHKDEWRALLDTLLATAPVGLCFLDRDLRFVLINDALAAIDGLRSDDHIGRYIAEVLPDIDPAVVEAYRQVLETGLPVVDLEVTGLGETASGDPRYFLASYYPVAGSDNRTLGVGAVVSEITERKRAVDELRESEERFRSMADSAPVLLWMSGTDGLCYFFNKPWLDFTGRTLEQEIGNGWAEGVHPADFDRRLEIYLTNFHARQSYQMEYRLRRADGEYRWVLDSGVPRYTPAGAFVGFIGSCIDITERKRAEELLRFPAEASSVLAASLDYETTVQNVARLVVPFLADWCGVDLIEDDGSIRPYAVAHVDPAKVAWARELRRRYPTDPDARTGLANVLRTGQAELYPLVADEMLQATARDAGHLELMREVGFTSVMIVPLVARGRTIGGLSLVSAESGRRFDEADLKLAEHLAYRAALAVDNARLYQDAQEAIHVRDEFLSIAAHELKTPVTSLLAYTQVLQRRATRDKTANERDLRALQVIAEQSERLSRLISSLLDLSRIETGHFMIERRPVDIAALARRVVEQTKATAEQHVIELKAPAEPVTLHGDDLRLEQVMQNLLQNAVKYSPGGGTITVEVAREADQAAITIADQGMGIPESARSQLFQRFFRAGNVNTSHISGMGIGLYVVREIVARHGGAVEVRSVEGEGTTFIVRLPLDPSTMPTSSES